MSYYFIILYIFHKLNMFFIDQDVRVVILVVKTVIICPDKAVIIYIYIYIYICVCVCMFICVCIVCGWERVYITVIRTESSINDFS